MLSEAFDDPLIQKVSLKRRSKSVDVNMFVIGMRDIPVRISLQEDENQLEEDKSEDHLSQMPAQVLIVNDSPFICMSIEMSLTEFFKVPAD